MTSEFMKALVYFPELQNTYIFIRETNFKGVQHTVRAYPPMVTVFCKISNWVYPIDINKNTKINIPFDSLTPEQQIGLFLHEFSHISEYVKFSRSMMFRFSFLYFLNKKFVRRTEHETDIKVIEKGAGFYLLSFRIHQLSIRMKNPYSETGDTYLTAQEIITYMKNMPDIYSVSELKNYEDTLTSIVINNQEVVSNPKISFYREITHSFKTAYTFIPILFQMIYIINIKKIHRR